MTLIFCFMEPELKTSISDSSLANSSLAVVFGMGIMVSPDALAMLGRFAGQTGFAGIGFLLAGCLIYTGIASQYRRFFSDYNFPHPLFSALSLASKSIMVLFLGTGLLVSSGFVFNEIFIYWFPNFGFAFILLFFLAGLQLLPQRYILICQFSFVGIAIIGLFILIGCGFFQGLFQAGEGPVNTLFPNTISLPSVFMPLLFFVGFDMGLFYGRYSDDLKENKKGRSVFFIIAGMTVIFMLWVIVAWFHVPLSKLSGTAISHIKIARTVLGEPGRYIMGVIVISGSLAAVHALFTAIQYDVAACAGKPVGKTRLSKGLVLIIGSVIGILMIRGLAGYDILETLITGAFIFWLFNYLLVSVAAFVLKPTDPQTRPLKIFGHIINLVLCLVLASGVIILILKNAESVYLIKFLAVAILISTLISAVVFFVKKIINHD